MLAQLAELYVAMRGAPLVGQIFSGQNDEERIKSSVEAMDEGLSFLEHFMPRMNVGLDYEITIADCALAPFLYFFADRLVSACDQPAIIDNHPAVAAYWHGIQTVPACQTLLDEMRTAIAKSPLKLLVANRTI